MNLVPKGQMFPAAARAVGQQLCGDWSLALVAVLLCAALHTCRSSLAMGPPGFLR